MLFFALTILLFLDFRNMIAPAIGDTVLYLQFVPSLLKYVHGAALGAAGFIVVLLITVAVGRVYCSTACPLGTLQDIIGFISEKKQKHNAFDYRKPANVLRYLILSATALLSIAGSSLLLNFLDPFSAFGRVITNIFRPIGIVVNNAAAAVLEQYGIYSLAREHWAAMAPFSTGVAMATVLFVIWLSATRGRLYCNSICPVGALLGIVARFSVMRIEISEASCTGCKRCETVCKASCIDLTAKSVDMSRCVGCYNCLAVCKTNGIYFTLRGAGRKLTAKNPDPERREYLFNSGVVLLAVAGLPGPTLSNNTIKTFIQSKPTTVPVVTTSPVSPPGSGSVAHFTARCTACHLCVSACPSQVLLPSFLEYGLSGMMQPRMYFQTGHCNYECTICTDVCPTGALLPLKVDEKKLTQTGVAKFIKENCVVYTDNTACGACSEHCPTKAVNMVPYDNPLGKPLGIPEIKTEYCVGCGGCEHACPTKPYKAIFVDGNPVHISARKPIVQKIDQKVDYQEDFPF
jgi:ferredoxin